MSYYYGDYYGEEATPCDPYYDDCTDAAVDEEPEEDYYGEEMVEEEKPGVPMLVLAWGLVPVLDIASGLWINNDWKALADNAALADNKVWRNSFYASVATGGLGLVMWGATVFMGPPFGMWIAVNVVLEAVNLYLVYAAEKKWPNKTPNLAKATQSTNFAYGAHGFGLLFSAAAAMPAMAMGAAPEEEYADEYADEEEPVDEEPVDEEPTDDTYGDYYGYY